MERLRATQQNTRKNRGRIPRHKEISSTSLGERSHFGTKPKRTSPFESQYSSKTCGRIEKEGNNPSALNSGQNYRSDSGSTDKPKEFEHKRKRCKSGLTGLHGRVPSRFSHSGIKPLFERNVEVEINHRGTRENLFSSTEAPDRSTLNLSQSFSSASGKTEKSEEIDHARKCSSSRFAELDAIASSQFLPTGTNEVSLDDDRDIVTKPVEVTRDSERDLIGLVYGRGHNTPLDELETMKQKKVWNIGKNANRKCNEETSTTEDPFLRKEAPSPQDMIAESHHKTDVLRSSMTVASFSEVVDNVKYTRARTACVLALVLALTCVGWYFMFSNISPAVAPKRSYLQRYLLDHTYKALLNIYR